MKNRKAITSPQHFKDLYQQSIENPNAFWAEQANYLDWQQPFNTVSDWQFDPTNLKIRWFIDGKLNVAVNCIDRHLVSNKHKTAIIWEPDDPTEQPKKISFEQLYQEVAKLSNAMQSMGVKAGDRVILYMPMIPELAYACLACARLGAIHSVVFGGFSANALSERIADCGAKWLFTASYGRRGVKTIPLKSIVDEALSNMTDSTIEKVIVVNYLKDIALQPNEVDYHSLIQTQPASHQPQSFDSEHPLFILYTSGSTGKPKGILHSSGGYLTYVSTTHFYSFDIKANDVYWCSADIGWITGHSYLLYGPLANGCTTLMFEGVPNFPSLARFGEVIDRHQVSVFYTAPTAIRTLMTDSETALQSQRDSLRILGTVGEPINPDVWNWYAEQFGNNQCSVVDTWWQTETGGHLIAPLPNSCQPKPGSAMYPCFGIEAGIVNSKGQLKTHPNKGHLVFKSSWPGQARTIWNDHDRFIKTYFSQYVGYYFSGDGAKVDSDNCYWITGRVDDVLNISGHRLGTAEIENAVVSVAEVAEAAVVGTPHPIKGETIMIFAIPKTGIAGDDALTNKVITKVRTVVGPIATPDYIIWHNDLPKTRSGKIIRRILRKIACGDYNNLGDISTLSDPQIVEQLIASHQKLG